MASLHKSSIRQPLKNGLNSATGWDGHRRNPLWFLLVLWAIGAKDLIYFFLAWEKLCAYPDWDADLVVIGCGAELPVWQRRASEAGIASRIHFLGFRSDVPDLLRGADCLVAPTRYEAYGLGVHEALCCGLPALVSATAGVAERYPSQLGDLLLPDPEDVGELVARLRRWREDTQRCRKMVSSVSEALRSYAWDDMVRSILEKIEVIK